MTDSKRDASTARYERFLALARGDGFTTKLANSAVPNEGDDHRSDVMIERSRRAVDSIMGDLFAASAKLVDR